MIEALRTSILEPRDHLHIKQIRILVGWVGIAQKTGFGMVPFLPGIWSSLHLDTAVTLPVGVECYAAYAPRS